MAAAKRTNRYDREGSACWRKQEDQRNAGQQDGRVSQGLADNAVAAAEVHLVRTSRMQNGQKQPEQDQACHQPKALVAASPIAAIALIHGGFQCFFLYRVYTCFGEPSTGAGYRWGPRRRYNRAYENPGTCGGKPRIAGSRIRVQDVAFLYEDMEQSTAEIHSAYPHLRLSEIHAALAYYFDHKDQIRQDMANDDAFFEEYKRLHPEGSIDQFIA